MDGNIESKSANQNSNVHGVVSYSASASKERVGSVAENSDDASATPRIVVVVVIAVAFVFVAVHLLYIAVVASIEIVSICWKDQKSLSEIEHLER